MITKKYDVPELGIYVEITENYEWECDAKMASFMEGYSRKYTVKTVEVKETSN